MSALDTLIDHHDSVHHAFALDHDILSTDARAELAALRADLANVTAERDALAAEYDAIHRAVNEMCGTDTSIIEAVQHVINERDAARAQLAIYERQKALRQ